MSHNQARRTHAPLHCSVSYFASCVLTSSNSTNKFTASSTTIASKVWKALVMGRCNKHATSSRVMVSSFGRWKLLVSLCHLFTKTYKNPLSPISNEHLIRKLNHIAATMPSISSADLPNFSSFLP